MPKWIIQNANDDYSRFQIEEAGVGIIMRVEHIGNTSYEDAQLIASAPELLAAVEAVDRAFMDGEIQLTKKRRSDSDPYHPANTLMTIATARVRGEHEADH